jgi:uncharacterized tellurite resistance protein B-like protein
MFNRLFGKPEPKPPVEATPAPQGAADATAADTATVRRIVAKLDALPPDQARFVACVAYVAMRAANADLVVTDEETAYMEQALQESAGLDEAQAVLVVEMAKLQNVAMGGTEDYLVTREFREVSTPEQRSRVLRALLALTAVDGSINAAESAVINEIANELGIDDADLAALRGEFTDKFAAVQAARRAVGGQGA